MMCTIVTELDNLTEVHQQSLTKGYHLAGESLSSGLVEAGLALQVMGLSSVTGLVTETWYASQNRRPQRRSLDLHPHLTMLVHKGVEGMVRRSRKVEAGTAPGHLEHLVKQGREQPHDGALHLEEGKRHQVETMPKGVGDTLKNLPAQTHE
ncbi:hypothetical protein KC19_VG255800 [Ceratodon purpureus]|uniref:Uncharacterized protein n=1 Tax=Ceratodon purpureus TaxID=3225 RepID=A0A8T0HV62_CERPU|nr:hypothetical protein KC19_VG255800 [Ceratodon purpureus]